MPFGTIGDGEIVDNQYFFPIHKMFFFFLYYLTFPKRLIPDSFKLKVFADYISKFDETGVKFADHISKFDENGVKFADHISKFDENGVKFSDHISKDENGVKFADHISKFDENGVKFFIRVKNTVDKGEIARNEQFLLFPPCFQMTCTAEA